jgi:hypothetical protein
VNISVASIIKSAVIYEADITVVLSSVKTAIFLTKRQIKNARVHQQGYVTSVFIMVILILQETITDGKDWV